MEIENKKEITENLGKMIDLLADIALRDVCEGAPNAGDAIEVIEAYLNEGITEMQERSVRKINEYFYEAFVPLVTQRMKHKWEKQNGR